MFLSNFSIKQPVTTVAIVIVLMCVGLLAFKQLRVNERPDVEMPIIVVNIPYPGASPETVERQIINRVEKSLQSISQVHELRSTASEGQAQIFLQFDFKKDMSVASDEVRNAIAYVLGNTQVHGERMGLWITPPPVDPFAAGPGSDRPELYEPRCWLLRAGWMKARAPRTLPRFPS